MVQSKGGKFARTRNKMRRPLRERSKIKLSRFLQVFEEGDKVIIKPDSSYQKGIPFRRFWGKTASVIGRRGKATMIEFKDGNKKKKVISANVHLRKVKQ